MTQESYTPLALSNFFVQRWGKESDLEHMKLQKLVYCSHGWWLATREGSIVNEGPQVWRYGPVFESLYHVLKNYGRQPIRMPKSNNPFSEPDAIKPEDDNTTKLLEWVWERYGHMTPFQLSDMTHKKGTPWQRCAKENNFRVPRGFKIPDAYIRDEFREIMNAK